MTRIFSLLWQFDRQKMNAWVALRAALSVGLCFSLGFWLGHVEIAVALGIGALQVCYADNADSYRLRFGRMVVSTLLSTVAVLSAGLFSGSPFLLAGTLLLGAFAAGMWTAIDIVLAELSIIALATFLLFTAQELKPEQAIQISLFAGLGGVIATLISISLFPFRPEQPEKRALGILLNALADLCRKEQLGRHDSPQATQAFIDAQQSLHHLEQVQAPGPRRLISILSQAERMRLTILNLHRLRRRLGRIDSQLLTGPFLEQALLDVAAILKNMSSRLMSQTSTPRENPQILEFEMRLAKFGKELVRHAKSRTQNSDSTDSSSHFKAATEEDFLFHLRTLAGQCRTLELQSLALTERGERISTWLELLRPQKFRFWSTLDNFRANLTLKSPAFRHALRLSLGVGLGYFLSHVFGQHLHRAYWIPMTVAIVLRPDSLTTLQRGALRILGTLGGLWLATALYHALPAGAASTVLIIPILVFFTRWLGPANYGLFAMILSALVVFIMGLSGVSPQEVIWDRGINTLIGGALAMALYLLWPTSERLQIRENLERLLVGNRTYLSRVLAQNRIPQNLEIGSSGPQAVSMDQVRQNLRLIRTQIHTTISRLWLERQISFEERKIWLAVTVACNRFAQAVMSIEATRFENPVGLDGEGHAKTWPPETQEYLGKIERQLGSIIQELQSSEIRNKDLIDLRAELSTVPLGPMNEDLDQITNSLNTVQDYVRRLIRLRRQVAGASK